jgi:HEPN domain-containing protein
MEKMKEIVKEWLDKADKDLMVCEELMDNEEFSDAAAFHAQQSAEKYLKSLWEFFGVEIVKTHDLYFLREKLMEKTKEASVFNEADLHFLTQFAIDYRYPGENAIMGEAKDAYSAALKIKDISLGIFRNMGVENI